MAQAGSVWKWVRRTMAAILIVGAATLSLVSYLTPSLRTCREQLAQVGPSATARVCTPLGLSDLVLMLLAAMVFLWPDISEFSVPGLSVKRRLEQQAQRQDQLERHVQRLEQTVTQQTTVIVAPDWKAVEAEVEKKAPLLTEPIRHSGTRATALLGEERASKQTAQLESNLLRTWSQLDTFLRTGRGQEPDEVWLELNQRQRETVQRWRALFDEELQLVRAARNAVAHPPHHLSDGDLGFALGTANRLLSLLLSQLRHPSSSNVRPATGSDGPRSEATPGSTSETIGKGEAAARESPQE